MLSEHKMWGKKRIERNCTNSVPVKPFPPFPKQLIERSHTLLCFLMYCFFYCLVPVFSFYGCRHRPQAPSYGTSFYCPSDPTGRISPGPKAQDRTQERKEK
ncbi:hypothetical protein CHARACLAT_007832 [Characodon lateralis]|uniref:Uncharacterized protein n=1 Tax=Characodon lateralis TaxID=208331 RepID=A0ABU7DF38_9TELE|nr:hypothetical protein [Characodon lateralis]